MEVDVAYRLNPQDRFTAQGYGALHAVTGDAMEGIRILERCLRISPLDPYAFLTYSNLAAANFVTRDYRKGLDWAVLARNAAPTYANNLQVIVILHIALGQMSEARASLEAVLRVAPAFVQGRLDYRLTATDFEYQRRSTTFIRVAAGLEDPSAADALR